MPYPKFWTRDKLWELKEMYEDPDITIDEIAKHFDKPKTSIYTIAFNNEFKRGYYYQEGYLKCSKCEAVLPVEEFHKRKGSYSGYQSVCKECFREMKNSSMRRRIITEEEKQYVIKSYGSPFTSVECMARRLGMTKNQLGNYVSRLRRKGIKIRYINKKKESATNE